MDNASFMRIMSYNPLLDPLISKLDLKQSWKASNGTFRHSCRGSAELALTTLKNTGNMVLLFSKDKAKYNCAGRCRRGQWKILNTQRDSAEVDVSVSTLGDHSFSSAQKREGQSDKKEESLSTRESVYLFQTEGGGQVKVVVSSMDTRYKVNIEVLSLPQGFSNFEHDLRLHWGDISWDKGDRFHARRILLDPYSKFLAPFISGQDNLVSPTTCLGSLIEEPPFKWEEDSHPRLPLESLVVYRLNVGGFTADKSSGLQEDMRGTFLGLIGKLYHLKNLGVNAVMLEPIFAFDRRQGPFYPYNFFAPMDCYGPFGDGISASNSLKEMIKAFHKNGIEVILEVVYTHTAEKGDSAPETISFRGIDNSSYYIVDENNEVTAPETGNLFNCNHPTVQRMILDSLQHWVNEYHIDGFCFSNSSSLIRGPHGENLSRPPLIEAIAFDPILSKTKIIADPCLPIKASCKEIPFPHWKRWAELNIRFHDDVRSFLKGDKCQLSNFATRLCGSGDLFTDGRGPSFSFNFITSNFGLSLVDLVSFSDAEMTSTELSWNCGVEGPTSNPLVLETRLKQIRNFLFILFVSLGVPVLNMGDEYGHTKGGSVLLKDRKPFNWDALKSEFGVQTTRFIGYLSSLRLRRRDLLQRRNFVKIENLNWHGPYPKQPMWEDLSSSFLAVSLKPEENESESGSAANDLYIAFNSQQGPVIATLPQLSDGILWHRLVDTSLPFPETFLVEGATSDLSGVRFSTYEVKPYCCVLFEARMTS